MKMVWIYEQTDGKAIKKFLKNGMPDPMYFGGGFYQNREYDDSSHSRAYVEINPYIGTRKQNMSLPLASKTVRSIEIWKEPGYKDCKLVATCIPEEMEIFTKMLRTSHRKTESNIPDWLKEGYGADQEVLMFDVELDRQITFTEFDESQEPFLDKLIYRLAIEDAVFVQIIFSQIDQLSEVCRKSTGKLNKIGPKDKTQISITGWHSKLPKLSEKREVKKESKFYQRQKNIYEKRKNEPLVAVSIRGFICTKSYKSTLDSLKGLFEMIKVQDDKLIIHDYPLHRDFGQYMTDRTLSSQHGFNTLLAMGSNIWSKTKWGEGKDFVPFLVMNHTELNNIFLKLPTDIAIPVTFQRETISKTNPKKVGFLMGYAR